MLHNANEYYILIDASPKCELDQATCALLFHETEPELFNKSEQNHSDKARKQANDSDMVKKSGKSFRLGEKIRLTSDAPGFSREGHIWCASSAHTAPNKQRTWRKSRSVF